jgi:hypothetical protein
LTAYFLFFINEGRTGYLVFIALFLLFLYQKSHWKGLLSAVVLAPLLLIGLFFVSPNFQQRAEWIKQDIENYYQHRLKDNSVGLRMVFIGNSLRLVSYHPIVGTGVGSFQTEYAQHFAPAPGFENMRHPQIDYLLIAVQLGMLGLLVFLALFYSEWRASFLLDKKNRDLAQGFILAFMVGTTCDSLLYLAIPGYFFIYFTSLFFAPRTLKLGKNALPRHYQDPRYPLKLKPQQKIAFVMSPRLGDALISMVTVHNLQRNHFQVTVWSDHLYDLRAWFPGVEIQRRPQAEQTHAIFSAFDVVLHAFFVDVIGNMQNWHPGVFILEYSTYNWLNINMIDIQVQFCQYLLGLQNVVRENGMRAPAALQYRQSLQRIIIHPTSSSATKNWLSQRFVALAQRLKQQQWQPELVVSNAERPAWLWVETQNLALPVFKNIDGVARYLYQSGWFIGNDSGLGHLASALGIPTLTLCMRPKVAKKWRPGWAVGLVLLPPKWLITRPLKEKFWKYFITVKQVLKNFVRLQTMSMQEK